MNISTFLGNKGKKFENTRHNLSWLMFYQLSFFKNLAWNTKFKGEYAKDRSAGVLLKPMTMMNKSGESVAAALSFFKTGPENLIVIHDDLELPFGTVQLKKGGGTGGHNGLRSIINAIGSNDFYRFRLGISRPPAHIEVASWVLNRFSPEEEALLNEYCNRAAHYFEGVLNSTLRSEQKTKLM